MINNTQEIDNGGAEAIKGFNFQKANLILLAIENYKKSGFKIYIEAEDDIVVSYDDYQAFIQVKKQEHRFSTLTIKEKNKKKNTEKKSILEKNLSNGSNNDTFKIFVTDFGKTDLKNLILREPGNICDKLYELSDVAKQKLSEKLPKELISRLDNFYIYISSISEDFNDAEKHLVGSLNKSNIAVDNNRGRNIIAELCLTVDQKGQKKVLSAEDKNLKYLSSEYLNKVFVTSEAMTQFDSVLERLSYSTIKKGRIKQQRNKINIALSELKKEIVTFIKNIPDYEEITDQEIIDKVISSYMEKYNDNELIAITIEIICEVGGV